MPTAEIVRLLRHFRPEPTRVPPGGQLRNAFGAALGMFAVTLISYLTLPSSALPLVAASMGASSVLLFALPGSPLAQPWPFAGSHLLSAAIGVACSQWIPDLALAAAVAVGLSVWVMHRTHCMHPPGGAAALLPVVIGEPIRDTGFAFVIEPIALNVAVLLTAALLINNLLLGRRYPARPYEPQDTLHLHGDPKSLDRVGITHDDLHEALAELDTYLDVSEADLNRVYRSAAVHAYRRRLGVIRAADVMSRDVIRVHPRTPVEEAWALLRRHKVKMLPVVNDDRHLVGVVSLVDVLKRVDLRTYRSLGERLVRYVRGSDGERAQPHSVGEIMSRRVVSVAPDKHIAELVPLLSDEGYHHLPVVDGEGQLLGIVTQSDLIAALYAEGVGSAAPEGLAEARADDPRPAPDAGNSALAWRRREPE